MSAAPGPTRRGLLALVAGTGAVLVLPGCTSEPEAAPPPDPDDLLRASAVQREKSLIQAYDDALLAAPPLTARLLMLREQHAAHLEALRGPAPSGTPSPTRSSGPGGAGPGAPATGPPAVPGGPAPTDAATLARLVAAENAAAAAHAQAALAADERRLAVLLATLAASEQSHPVALA